MSELTAGFHMDLTGRTNVYAKGQLLGLSTKDISHLMGDITTYAGLQDHLDRPVKTYSSGMLARLAFSTTIHLDADIYLIDEVLSVGDRTFQRMCLDSIRTLHTEGKTMVISSHSLGDLGSICDRVILMDRGCIIEDGPTERVLKRYFEMSESESARITSFGSLLNAMDLDPQQGDRPVTIEHVQFLNAEGEATDIFPSGCPLTVRITFSCHQELCDPLIRVQLHRNDGLFVCGTHTKRHAFSLGHVRGRQIVELTIESLALIEGDYYVSVGIWPDEYRSFLARAPLALHDRRHIIHVTSQREDGAGIVRTQCGWRRLSSEEARA